MNTQRNYMKPSSQEEAAAKDTHPATLGVDDGGRSTHNACRGCECVGSHAALDTPAGPGAQDWEHWEWTGGDTSPDIRRSYKELYSKRKRT